MIIIKSKYSPSMRVPPIIGIKNLIKYCYFSIPNFMIKSITTTTKPVFVVGCGHSGTTLISTLLSRNSSVFPIGYESGIFLPEKGLYNSKNLIISWDNLARQYNKSIFIEKTPKHCLCIKNIFKILPDSRILYIVRNGLDNVSSLRNRFGSIKIPTERWIIDNKPIKYWIDDKRVSIIHYEDIILNTSKTLKEICEFININYEDCMLYSNYTPYKNSNIMNVRVNQVMKPIYNNLGKWRDELSRNEIIYFLSNAAELMEQLGYEVADSFCV